MLNKGWVLFFLVLFTAQVAHGETDSAGPMPSLASLMAQTAVGLAVVLIAIAALAWVVKKLNVSNFGGNKTMQVLSVLPVGTREKVVLVEVGGQQLLLGVAPGRVNAVHVFDTPVVEAPAVKEKTASMPSLAASTASEFSKKLNEFLGQGSKS